MSFPFLRLRFFRLSSLNAPKLVTDNFLNISLYISVNSFPGNKEGLQEIHEAYQILLKIIMGAKNRFKKKSQVFRIYTEKKLFSLL